MDINQYKNDGWGLSKLAFNQLFQLTKKIINKQKTIRILEFGSGISTTFFINLIIENSWEKKAKILSFDDNERYVPKTIRQSKSFSKNSNFVMCWLSF